MSNAAPPRVDPKLLGYGDTFGTYAGRNLGDTDIYETAIDSSLLNKNLLSDGIELSTFEQHIRDYILARLGHPVVRVELTDFQIKSAIDEAITKLHYHAPSWTTQFATFETSAGINSYLMPLHIAHNLEYVTYRKSLLTVQNIAGSLEYDFFIKYFQDNFVFGNFSVSEYYLLQSHLEMVRKILSNDGSWEVINGNVLHVTPIPINREPVILVYRALDPSTLHPFYTNWIQRYALAVAKGILGEIRGKFSNLPSPQGGVSLNGSTLLAQSVTEKEQLEYQLLDEIEEPPSFSMF